MLNRISERWRSWFGGRSAAAGGGVARDDAAFHFEAALAHNRRGDAENAAAEYMRALDIRPDYTPARVNLGLIYLTQLGDPQRAQQQFERAVASDPGSVAAQANLGLALQDRGRLDDALAHYEKLLAAYPKVHEYRWNRGLALLCRGDFARGWDDYESRNARGTGAPARAFPYPVWNGEALADEVLLVYGEQGLGDEIMFASCVPDLLERGIRCVLECDQRLANLFRRSFPAAQVHGAARDGDRSWLARHPQIGRQIACGSLPRILRRDEAAFPRHAGYLRADAGRVAHWRAQLAPGAEARTLIGVAWRGGGIKTRGRLRSIPLPQLAPLFALPQITWISLQRDGDDELAQFATGTVRRCDDALEDTDETAALISALDCVVTADSTTAHLAAALGRPTKILLAEPADWRWMRNRATSPWYPSAVLYRQQRPGDWSAPVAAASAALRGPS
jgi:Flp pilus assembly protein TadD